MLKMKLFNKHFVILMIFFIHFAEIRILHVRLVFNEKVICVEIS